jgi:hypothetical protein
MNWKKILKDDKGVGDTIARMTKAVGIKPCGACNKRKDKLNDKFSYKK